MRLLPKKLTKSSLLSYLHKESTFELRRITNLLPSVEVTFQVPCEIIFLSFFMFDLSQLKNVKNSSCLFGAEYYHGKRERKSVWQFKIQTVSRHQFPSLLLTTVFEIQKFQQQIVRPWVAWKLPQNSSICGSYKLMFSGIVQNRSRSKTYFFVTLGTQGRNFIPQILKEY